MALDEIRKAVDGIKVGGVPKSQYRTLNTARSKQFFIVFAGGSREGSNHVAVGIVTNGRKRIYDPQKNVIYKDISQFYGGYFTAWPVIF